MISQKLLLDSTKVGIVSVVLGYLIIFVMKIIKIKANKEIRMSIGLFLLGFVLNILLKKYM
tara:strand:- start:140 stop:322 length:183 start_codon:yes stop_codon:yes gene_type:complete